MLGLPRVFRNSAEAGKHSQPVCRRERLLSLSFMSLDKPGGSGPLLFPESTHDSDHSANRRLQLPTEFLCERRKRTPPSWRCLIPPSQKMTVIHWFCSKWTPDCHLQKSCDSNFTNCGVNCVAGVSLGVTSSVCAAQLCGAGCGLKMGCRR